jgi:hypothetical protein
MTVTQSGLFTGVFAAALGSTQLALDLSSASNRVALFANSVTPDFNAAPAVAAYGAGAFASGEVSGVGYSAGGALLSGQSTAYGAGLLTYDASDADWTASTITDARCALMYADGLAGNNAYCLINFGADYSTYNGLFRIQWNTAGIFYLDLA